MTAPDGPSEPRRLTPTERLHEVTMVALSRRPSEPLSEVELSRNAKGDMQFTVTVRGPDPFLCEQDAREIVERLVRVYPHSSLLTNELDLRPALEATVAEQKAAGPRAATSPQEAGRDAGAE